MCDCVSLYDILTMLPPLSPLLTATLFSARYCWPRDRQKWNRSRNRGQRTEKRRHLLSQRILRQNEAIAVTCSPTPLGNNSRLFGKSTACFIRAV